MSNRLATIPGANLHDVHHWTDYAELVCLSSPGRVITLGDIIDRIIPQLKDIRPDLVEDDPDDEDSEEGDEDRVEPDRKAKKRLALCHSILEYFKFRAAVYGDTYPFQIEHKSLKRIDQMSARQKMYVYCLMCSSLGYFEKEEAELTGEFELASHSVLSAIAGPKMRVLSFGKNSTSTADFTGNVTKKIRDLAEAMGERCIINDEDYPATSTGDRGLDLVAIDDYGDNLSNRLTLFAQCKCSPDWKDTVHTSSHMAWSARIPMRCPNVNIAMIPFCVRRADGEWHYPADIGGFVLFDRQRLLRLSSDEQLAKFRPIQNGHVVDTFLAEIEPTE